MSVQCTTRLDHSGVSRLRWCYSSHVSFKYVGVGVGYCLKLMPLFVLWSDRKEKQRELKLVLFMMVVAATM